MSSLAHHIPCRLMAIDSFDEADKVRLVRDGARRQNIRLNPTAAAIWSLCDGEHTTDAISQELEHDLDLPAGSLLRDVEASIRQFVDAQLIVMREPSDENEAIADIDWRRVAEQQKDGYDTAATQHLLKKRIHSGRVGDYQDTETTPVRTIMDGRISIRFPYDLENFAELSAATADDPNIDTAAILLRHWPLGYKQFSVLMNSLHPVLLSNQPSTIEAHTSYCHSAEWMRGTMWSTVNCPLFLAENMVHELAHQKAFALGIYKEVSLGLITNHRSEEYTSPFRDYPRPMPAVFHAAYAIAYMVQLNLALANADIPAAIAKKNRVRLKENIDRLEFTLDEMRPNIKLDTDGKEFLAGYYDWVERMLENGSNALASSNGGNG